MVARLLAVAMRPHRALLVLAAGLLASLTAAAQAGPVAAAAAANGPNPLLWLLLAGLGIVGLMLVMTVGSAASALHWSADQAAAQATEAAPAAVKAAPVAVEATSAAARFAPAAAPVYSSEVVEKPVLC